MYIHILKIEKYKKCILIHFDILFVSWSENEWKVRTIKRVVADAIEHIEKYSRVIEKRIKIGKYKNMKDPDDPEKTLDTKTILKNFNNRLKKYINRYYDGDDEADEKQTKDFQKLAFRNIQNELFNYKNSVCNNFYKILDEVEKIQDDKELKEVNQFTKSKIEELKKLIEDDKDDMIDNSDEVDKLSELSELDGFDEEDEDIKESKEPVYVLKEVTLASGLKTKKWLREDEEYN